MEKKILRVLAIKVNQPVRVVEVTSLRNMQELVGGNLDPVNILDSPWLMVCNVEARPKIFPEHVVKFKTLPHHFFLEDREVFGDVFIVRQRLRDEWEWWKWEDVTTEDVEILTETFQHLRGY